MVYDLVPLDVTPESARRQAVAVADADAPRVEVAAIDGDPPQRACFPPRATRRASEKRIALFVDPCCPDCRVE